MRGNLTLLSFLLMSLSTASAQANDDVELCFTGSGSFRIDIDICERAIRSGAVQGISLAPLHVRLGVSYKQARAYPLALQAFDRALALNPVSASAYLRRGETKHEMGDYRAAIEAHDKAIRLFPGYWQAMRGRGISLFFLYDFQQSIENFSSALLIKEQDPESRAFRGIVRIMIKEYEAAERDLTTALDGPYPYPLGRLWAYFALRRSGGAAVAYLDRFRDDVDPAIWPGQLFALYEVKSTAEAVLAAAARSPAAVRPRRQLQTVFYTGLLALADGRAASAKQAFDTVIRSELNNLVEKVAARAFLDRLSR